MSETGDVVRALEPLVDAFESLGVTYRVCTLTARLRGLQELAQLKRT